MLEDAESFENGLSLKSDDGARMKAMRTVKIIKPNEKDNGDLNLDMKTDLKYPCYGGSG
jgi:hypothetical protein